ncbi:MAG: glycosyltransferase [Candidatus Delongbacteria bacterium]|nr:glycosyltransferase [Candidatus Delongbacteria bacterium]MBN2836304.1 glycosyltransferase [Candidatus Delongbacteria bacterium]
MDISIVILNYNVKYFLENCIRSIYQSKTKYSYEVIVCDNASHDGSKEYIQERFENINYIYNNSNLGFAKGNNIGLRQARGRYLLVLNPDTLLRENTLENCIDYLEKDSTFDMITCKVITPGGEVDSSCHRSFPTALNALSHITGFSKILSNSKTLASYNMLYLDNDEISEVDAISGSFMLYRRTILEKDIFLPEDYFMYGEDIDFCFQIKKSGFKIGYVPIAEVVHYRGQSTKKKQIAMKKHFYHSMNIFITKNYSSKYSFFFKIALNFGVFLSFIISIFSTLIKKFLLPILDVLSYFIALLVSLSLYQPIVNTITNKDSSELTLSKYFIVSIIYIFVMLSACFLNGNYDKYKHSFKNLLTSMVYIFLTTTSITFFLKNFAFSRIVLLIMMFFTMALMTFSRLVIIRKIKLFQKRTMIVGIDENSLDLVNYEHLLNKKGLKLIGLIDQSGDYLGKSIGRFPIYGNVQDIRDIIKLEKLEHIIFSVKSLGMDNIMDLIGICKDNGVTFSINFQKHNSLKNDFEFFEINSRSYY